MPLRIDNPRHAVTPELICKRSLVLRSGGDSPLDHCVHAFEIKIDHYRRTAIRRQGTTGEVPSLSAGP